MVNSIEAVQGPPKLVQRNHSVQSPTEGGWLGWAGGAAWRWSATRSKLASFEVAPRWVPEIIAHGEGNG